MNYPAELTYGRLKAESPEFSETKYHLARIALLAEGGWKLKDSLGQFLEQRTGEADEVYELRLKKFTYSNTFGSSLSQLAAKFSNGALALDGAEPESFWTAFRQSTNGSGRTEQALITQMFTELLSLRTVWLHVDKPSSEQQPKDAAEEKALGLTPRIVLYNALQVPDWEIKDGRLRWIKTFQLVREIVSPTEPPLTHAVWRFIDSEKIAIYSAIVDVKKGIEANICNKKGEPVERLNPDTKISLLKEVSHGFGRIPVVHCSLDHRLWGGNQAFPMAEQELRLECHGYDYLACAYPQRTFKRTEKVEDALGAAFADEEDRPLPTGLQYLLELDSFDWNEPKGDILVRIDERLASAKRSIRGILSVGGAYLIDKQPTALSGASKDVDFEVEDERLESYGHIFCDAIQEAYRLVAIAAGHRSTEKELSVSGLDDFSRKRLATLLSSLKQLLEIDMRQLEETLTPTLYLLIREKLMSFLVGNLSTDQKKAVEAELKNPSPELKSSSSEPESSSSEASTDREESL